jgi:hypothetical protein
MAHAMTDIHLTTADRETLERMARARSDRADLATRAQAILWLAGGAVVRHADGAPRLEFAHDRDVETPLARSPRCREVLREYNLYPLRNDASCPGLWRMTGAGP